MAIELFPVFDRMLSRADKEALLHSKGMNQRGTCLWFTGLSGSGKSTLCLALERELQARGMLTRLLDGDNVRQGLCAGLGFSEDDRRENIRRIAEVARLFVDTGVVVLCAFVSPMRELRQMAREIVGAADFKEVFVATPLAVCEARDVKGLYAKARRGESKQFTGISAPFEAPENPDLILDTSTTPFNECLDRLIALTLSVTER